MKLPSNKVLLPLVKISRRGLRFLTKNSNVILTVVSAAGVIATVTVAIHGTIKAVKLYEEKKPAGTRELVKTVWKCYIPTIGLVILTTTAIICNGRINAKKIAVLTSAYSGSVEALKRVEEKMSSQIGPKKTQQAVDEAEASIAQDHVPKNKDEIIATGKGTQLFYCRSTGQWFYSDRNGVELAELKIRQAMEDTRNQIEGEYFPLSEVQEALGLPVTEMGEYMGYWLDDFRGNVKFNLIISSDWMDLPWGKEVVGIVRFDPWPQNI